MPILLLVALTASSIAVAAVLTAHFRYRQPLKALLEELEADEHAPALPSAHATPMMTRLTDKIQRLQASNHLLHQQTIKDPLTRLGNRRLLEQRLEIALPLSRRWMSAVSALMIDVDHFKEYNDLYGHQAGDDCLIEIADVLRDTFRRETDIVVRLGGEEFLVVLLGAEEEDALRLAEAMRGMLQAVGIPHATSRVADVVTVSIGVSTTEPGMPVDLDEIMATADAALYACKTGGRNRVTSRRVLPKSADSPSEPVA